MISRKLSGFLKFVKSFPVFLKLVMSVFVVGF